MSDEQDKTPTVPADNAPVTGANGDAVPMPRKGRAATMVLALLLLLGLVGWATWPYWSGHVPGTVKETVSSLLSDLPLPPLATNGTTAVPFTSAPEAVPASPAAKPVTEPTPPPAVTAPSEPPAPPPAVVAASEPEIPSVTQPDNAPSAPSDTALQERLNAMEQALTRMQEQMAQQAGTAQRLDTLEARERLSAGLGEQVDGLARQLDGLTRQMTQLQQNAATASTVLALSERVARLEQTQARTGLLLLATVQLHSAVQAGRNFAVEWQAVQSLGKDQPAVMQVLSLLEPWQQTGIPPFGQLAQQFEMLEPVAIRAGLLPEQDGWWRQTLDHLLSLVVVRREDGSQAGDGATAFLGRASEAMVRHDIARAIAEVEGIQDPAAAAVMGPWLERARVYNQAETSLSHLTATLLAAVGSTAKL